MNKTAIKNFAIAARLTLIDAVTQRAFEYEITEKGENNPDQTEVNGKALTPTELSQRRQLIARIRRNGFAQTMEEAAYTWFNRFIALRYMEVNGYLPTRIRVFTDENNAFKPEILSEASRVEITATDSEGIERTYTDRNYILDLLDAQQNDTLYKYLLIAQCNALNCGLPEMFEEIGGWTELLFPNNLLRNDSVIAHMVEDIPEDDWKDQVQIIGWLYQYYNSEKKDAVFAAMSNKVKVSKENIAAATQLFTPDWIVRYMVENSLGRLWVDGHADTSARSEWKYYLDEAEQTAEVQAQLTEIRAGRKDLTPEQIRFIDPCMGSGHILVYAFDVLMQIYVSCGYTERDAAQSIVRSNLWGLDLDKRAYQLAYFAVMMKARHYDRRFLTRGIKPNLSHFQDLPIVNYSLLDEPIKSFVEQFENADTYGSLITVQADDEIDKALDEFQGTLDLTFGHMEHLMNLYKILSQRYDVVCTNPPYMGANRMNSTLSAFLKDSFPESKFDLFAAFIERCISIATNDGYCSLITPQAFMFLQSYDSLRNKLIHFNTIINMSHYGFGAFGADFGTTAFCLGKTKCKNYIGTYVRLSDYHNVDEKEMHFSELSNRYRMCQNDYSKIQGSPFSYWISGQFLKIYSSSNTISHIAPVKAGMKTGDNKRFLRLWFEVSIEKTKFDATEYDDIIKSGKKWFPYNKGGESRLWYGNHEYVLNFENNGAEIISQGREGDYRLRDKNNYFKESLSWSFLTAGRFSIRYYPKGFLCDVAGSSIYPNKDYIHYILGLLASIVANRCLKIQNPTLNFQVENISQIPFIDLTNKDLVNSLVAENITLCKEDWDSFETSWDFKKHPFIRPVTTIKEAYEQWEQECNDRRAKLKDNEEELNRIFIEIYGLQDELTPEVDDKDITVRAADLQRDMRSFVSYAVGCMFGRYSLDTEGLAYAGGEWDESKYKRFIPDKDNVIPICDDTYFEDDLTARVIEFVRVVYGEDTLEDNLRFIADALGGKGSPREVLRNYLLTGFFADHCKIYQKRPIYWLFSSGKKHGFKALVYMHRWKKTTVATVRTDYVHELQERYRTQLSLLGDQMQSASASDHVKLKKRQEKLTAQLTEINAYEEKVHHLADMMIDIDLDDGVKVNYAKFTDILEKIK